MDAKIKSDFLVALRSGEYTKTEGCLAEDKRIKGKTVKCHCGQGVLADLAHKAGVVDEVKVIFDPLDEQNFYSFDGMAATLPAHVLKWAGLSSREALSIQILNDGSAKATLGEIADYVEENL